MHAPRRVRSAVRRLGLDRNPLRRFCDRLETAAKVLAFAAAIAVTVLAAQWTVSGYWGASRAAASAAAHRDEVRAVLLANTPFPSSAEPAAVATVPVAARWTAPDGAARTGTIEAPTNLRAGASVTIWTDARGVPVVPPPSPTDVVLSLVMVGVSAWGAALAVISVLYALARRLLDRSRAKLWDRELATFGDHGITPR